MAGFQRRSRRRAKLLCCDGGYLRLHAGKRSAGAEAWVGLRARMQEAAARKNRPNATMCCQFAFPSSPISKRRRAASRGWKFSLPPADTSMVVTGGAWSGNRWREPGRGARRFWAARPWLWRPATNQRIQSSSPQKPNSWGPQQANVAGCQRPRHRRGQKAGALDLGRPHPQGDLRARSGKTALRAAARNKG